MSMGAITDGFKLLEAAGLFFEPDDEMGPHWLNMNDVWGWACGDAEEVTEADAPELARLFRNYGWCGVLYWVSEKRGGATSEFLDNNRFIEFVRHEETLRKEVPDSSTRAYKKLAYKLG